MSEGVHVGVRAAVRAGHDRSLQAGCSDHVDAFGQTAVQGRVSSVRDAQGPEGRRVQPSRHHPGRPRMEAVPDRHGVPAREDGGGDGIQPASHCAIALAGRANRDRRRGTQDRGQRADLGAVGRDPRRDQEDASARRDHGAGADRDHGRDRAARRRHVARRHARFRRAAVDRRRQNLERPGEACDQRSGQSYHGRRQDERRHGRHPHRELGSAHVLLEERGQRKDVVQAHPDGSQGRAAPRQRHDRNRGRGRGRVACRMAQEHVLQGGRARPEGRQVHPRESQAGRVGRVRGRADAR